MTVFFLFLLGPFAYIWSHLHKRHGKPHATVRPPLPTRTEAFTDLTPTEPEIPVFTDDDSTSTRQWEVNYVTPAPRTNVGWRAQS